MEKLGLAIIPYPKSYSLWWLNENGEIWVTKQVYMPFSIKSYHDEVLCDMNPMLASHILLRCPWQFDSDVTYNRWKNTYSFFVEWKKGEFVAIKFSTN